MHAHDLTIDTRLYVPFSPSAQEMDQPYSTSPGTRMLKKQRKQTQIHTQKDREKDRQIYPLSLQVEFLVNRCRDKDDNI